MLLFQSVDLGGALGNMAFRGSTLPLQDMEIHPVIHQ